jgi:hypothetical protein
MVRLGVVTGSALDAGGSTTMAFNGKLLNRPSDPGGERSVAESLAILYTGVYAPPPTAPVVSPNGDGVGDRQQLAFKIVRPSTVTTSLVGPGGANELSQTDERAAGVYKVTWPSAANRRRQTEPLGRWRWVVTAVDDLGRKSSVERSFWLNDTLGYMRVAPRAVKLRSRGRNVIAARFKLAYKARVIPTIWTRSGVLVRKLPAMSLGPGTRTIGWNGRFANGRLVYRGSYVFKVYAQNAYGPVDLAQPFSVRR